MTDSEAVLAAAARLVGAFGAHDTAAYFGSFAAGATFVFHSHERPLRSRRDYQELWYGWERDGFRVLGCESSDQQVQVLGEVAVFTHAVRTRVVMGGVEETLSERETIVFQLGSSGWVAVHEHLSPAPA
jgi:ketosteroid isomerase-like protein